jgi:NADP-dependent 3-hydroxy acid dehydrogenase YdfG
MSVWFITGCSSGFGIGLARLALHAGHKVIATSRIPPKTLGGTWLQFDVCSPELSHVLDKALSIYGKIDVLVNNAGSSILGPVEDISDAEARSMMEVNFFAPLNIIRHVVPHMRERRSGTIINISSTAGIVAVPTAGIYAASKHALEGL